MKKIVIVTIMLIALAYVSLSYWKVDSSAQEPRATWWKVQSIDTMKHSRDLAREKLHDEDFDEIIEFQIKNIAELGATHVAVGTPYDEEFIPYLSRWVKYARQYNLSVWFRGNFSGWEGWFGYDQISEDEHHRLTEKFILENRILFQDGDIFTPCPECENGGFGDPRDTGRAAEFRKFLVDEHVVASTAFRRIGRDVSANYFSMNGDVADLIMNKETTETLGGIIVVDHYVASPEQLATDVGRYASNSGGRVVLGEIGVPIPDIHGRLSDLEQAEWAREALAMLAKDENLEGVNYWVFSGGTTALWGEDGNKKEIADVLGSYYKPKKLMIKVTDQWAHTVSGAKVRVAGREFVTGGDGRVEILFVPGISEIEVLASGYKNYSMPITSSDELENVKLETVRNNLLFRILLFFRNLL